jgi:hypothetical protein
MGESFREAVVREELERRVEARLRSPARLTKGLGCDINVTDRPPLGRLIGSLRGSWERCHAPTGEGDVDVTDLKVQDD